jgi:hypothetical protein
VGDALGGGGRGAHRWWGGVRRRRTWRSPAGRHGAEEAGVPIGEAMGEGGRGTHWWRGSMRRSRKRCSPAGEARGGGGRDVRSGGTGSGGWRRVGWSGRWGTRVG